MSEKVVISAYVFDSESDADTGDNKKGRKIGVFTSPAELQEFDNSQEGIFRYFRGDQMLSGLSEAYELLGGDPEDFLEDHEWIEIEALKADPGWNEPDFSW